MSDSFLSAMDVRKIDNMTLFKKVFDKHVVQLKTLAFHKIKASAFKNKFPEAMDCMEEQKEAYGIEDAYLTFKDCLDNMYDPYYNEVVDQCDFCGHSLLAGWPAAQTHSTACLPCSKKGVLYESGDDEDDEDDEDVLTSGMKLTFGSKMF